MSAHDEEAIRRCIELARISVQHGSHPFGAVVERDGEVISEGENTVVADLDITAHAETVAMRNACRALGRLDLSGCTLYTSCEPCWICSCAIRELGVARVVIATLSPKGGGYSGKFPILIDDAIERYGPPPEVAVNVLADEAQAMWREVGWPAMRDRH